VHRTLVAAIGVVIGVIVGCCPGMPRAAADNSMCGQGWCSFLAPSRNLGCEMNYQRGSGIADEVYCQTDSPPQSVRMSTDGAFKSCTGSSCLGNAGEGTPTLDYGKTVWLGPFSCTSQTSGVTCKIVSGRGFTISNVGITPVG